MRAKLRMPGRTPLRFVTEQVNRKPAPGFSELVVIVPPALEAGTRPFSSRFVTASNGILNYCRTKVRFGVVEAIDGNIRMLIDRERGYKNISYLLLKAKRMHRLCAPARG